MAHERRTNFEFYQAPQGPDASRQYSDWTQAILAQGDAISKPLLMLMQNIAAKQGQEREIAARNAERQDTLQYNRTRDQTHDQQWQKDYALRESEQSDRTQQEQYRRAQDTAGLDMTIASMDPGNSVQKPDPMLDRLVQMRNGMQPVPFSPMPQVAPRNEFLDTFIQQHMRNQERAQEHAQALKAEQDDYQGALQLGQNALAEGTMTKPEFGAYSVQIKDPTGRREAVGGLMKNIHAASTKAGDEAEYQAASKQWLKGVTADFAEQPRKIGDANSFLSVMDHSAVPPSEKTKMLAEYDKTLRGVGDNTPKEPATYLPGVGNIRFNSDLGKGGIYQLGADGSPMLPKRELGELNALAQRAADEHFKPGPFGTDVVAPEDRAAFLKQTKQQWLDMLGWQSYQPPGDLPGQSTGAAAPSAPAPAQQPAQLPALDGYTPAQITEAKRIKKEQGGDAAIKYLQDVKLQGSVMQEKPVAPAPSARPADFGERKGPGPF